MSDTKPAVTMPEKKRKRILTTEEILAYCEKQQVGEVADLRDQINEIIKTKKADIIARLDKIQ